ncbi:MAG: HNH endonuclease [Lachnospiraceae bacterium]|nr:HNH endonuclease [Lachnospiraceae bacterium]
MSISAKDRKMLWALSGNKCAICSCPLVLKSQNSNHIIVEECHIVSSKQNGPRHREMLNYDIFDNLILLCPKYHKIVDEDEETYTESKLQKIKHSNLRITIESVNQNSLIMFKVHNPIELYSYINGAEQYAKRFPIDCKKNYQLFEDFYNTLIYEFDLMNGEIEEFETERMFEDVFKSLNENGYTILATVKDNFGEYRLRTAFVYIMQNGELEELRLKLASA